MDCVKLLKIGACYQQPALLRKDVQSKKASLDEGRRGIRVGQKTCGTKRSQRYSTSCRRGAADRGGRQMRFPNLSKAPRSWRGLTPPPQPFPAAPPPILPAAQTWSCPPGPMMDR
jgi:hypothetical protein